jgi:hypothetical protein
VNELTLPIHPDTPTGALLEELKQSVKPGYGLWFIGGELRADLLELIRAARNVGASRVGLVSDGRLLSAPGAAEALARAGLSDAAIAVYAPSAAVHDYLVGVAGAFKKTVAGVRRLGVAGVRVRLTVCLSKSLLGGLGELCLLARELGVLGVRFYFPREEEEFLKNPVALAPRLRLVEEPLLAAIDRLRAMGIWVEVSGVPLCILGKRASAAIPSPAGFFGLRCDGCSLKNQCCGVGSDYARRFGFDELLPQEEPIEETTGAPEHRAGRPILSRVSQVRSWKGGALVAGEAVQAEKCRLVVEGSMRALKQKLVRLAGEGAKVLVLEGREEGRAELVREATRLGFIVEEA